MAVLKKRMFQPVNERRLRLLDGLEAQPVQPGVEAILEALFRPMLEAVRRQGLFARLLAFSLTDPGAYLKALVEEEFAFKTQRFLAALRRASPELTAAETSWRLRLSIGAFIYTAGNPQLLEITSQGQCDTNDPEAVLKRVVGFCTGRFPGGRRLIADRGRPFAAAGNSSE